MERWTVLRASSDEDEVGGKTQLVWGGSGWYLLLLLHYYFYCSTMASSRKASSLLVTFFSMRKCPDVRVLMMLKVFISPLACLFLFLAADWSLSYYSWIKKDSLMFRFFSRKWVGRSLRSGVLGGKFFLAIYCIVMAFTYIESRFWVRKWSCLTAAFRKKGSPAAAPQFMFGLLLSLFLIKYRELCAKKGKLNPLKFPIHHLS